jgi:uracil-DNA glycosylase
VSPPSRATALAALQGEIIQCQKCPRLVAWRQEAAGLKPRRYAEWEYWARPVPGFGDPAARVMIVGLAPAAHGGNRTGRIFTGDRSGDFLFASLYRIGFASQPTSAHRDDGLRLRGLYIGAVNRCCPPGNRPIPQERDNCLPYLTRELEILTDLRVTVALGSFAWDGFLLAVGALGRRLRPKPRFSHGREAEVGSYTLIGCFHPSQQNTFTGKLTTAMLEEVLERARTLAGLGSSAGGGAGSLPSTSQAQGRRPHEKGER